MSAWLEHLQLVTLDGPGVLFDWHAGLQRIGIENPVEIGAFVQRLQVLAAESEGTTHAPFRKWTDLLRQALMETRTDLRPAVAGLFSSEIGRLPTHADALPAIQGLREVLQVGLVANGDAQHHLDAAQTLRTRWDVCISSEELRAHQPTERAWDAIVRAGVTRAAVTRDAWLHVSTSEQALEMAKARGLKTCLVQRVQGDRRPQADVVVTDLQALTRQILEAKQGPLLVEIVTQPPAELREQTTQWLHSTLLPAMRKVPGVRSARLHRRENGELVEHYMFGRQQEVLDWQANFGAEQRIMLRDALGHNLSRVMTTARLEGAA